MKISVILPVVDVPIGSGKPCHWLKSCIQSVRDGGHEDFELLVGCDGHSPEIEKLVDDFGDGRLRYVAFDRTRSWGNHQCHELLAHHAKGEIVMWLNHDDSYAPGALAAVHEAALDFPGRPLFFRALIACNAVVWTQMKRPREDSTHVEVHVLATATPRTDFLPPYPAWKERAKKADLWWVTQVYDEFSKRGLPPVWCKDVILLVRPWAPIEPVLGRSDTTLTVEEV